MDAGGRLLYAMASDARNLEPLQSAPRDVHVPEGVILLTTFVLSSEHQRVREQDGNGYRSQPPGFGMGYPFRRRERTRANVGATWGKCGRCGDTKKPRAHRPRFVTCE